MFKVFRIDDPVPASMARIVHDIDVKDQKLGRPEASGIDAIIRSLSDSVRDDHKVLELGSVLLDAHYHYLSGGKKKR